MSRLTTLSLLTLLVLSTGTGAQQSPARVAGAASQQPVTVVGATAQVQGLVTVSFGAQVASVTNESAVIDGSRYVTSSSGRVLIKFSDGCNVPLGPNQWTEVDGSLECSKRMAAVQMIGDTSPSASLLGNDTTKLLGVAALLLAGASKSGSSSSAAQQQGTVGPVCPGGVCPPPTPTPE